MYTLELFKRITQVPRPSYHEGKIRQFLIDEATHLGYTYQVDSTGNLLIQVAGRGISANSPTLVLQGHMDMVCESAPGVPINFLEQALDIYEKDGYLWAQGTTLGADNGVGVALAFYCASLKDHPPLEILLTVDEEVSMSGAAGVGANFFTGKRLINLDSGTFGIITRGSAGGDDSLIYLPYSYDREYVADYGLELTLSGLKGGHSGGNIGLNRLSATKVVADFLEQCVEQGLDFRVIKLESGAAANAIARDAQLQMIFASQSHRERAMQLRSRLQSGDGEQLSLNFTTFEHNDTTALALTEAVQHDLMTLLSKLPHGVVSWQDQDILLPETSANLASVTWGDESIKLVVSYRSFDNSMLPRMQQQIEAIVGHTQASVVAAGAYPAWPPKPDSPLQRVCQESFEELFTKKAEVVARHVGLECGYWELVSPGIDVVSIGPNLYDLHSPTEHVEIASIGKMEQWLAVLMKQL